MASNQQMMDILTGGQKKALAESYLIDEFGFDEKNRADMAMKARAFGPGAAWDYVNNEIIGGFDSDSMAVEIFSKGLQAGVPFRDNEDALLKGFTLDQPVVNWVTSALNAWTLYTLGIEAATSSYIERVKNHSRSVSNSTTIDLPALYRLAKRNRWSLDDVDSWPTSLSEQAKFLGYHPNIRTDVFSSMDIWPDLNTILSWEFRNKASLITPTDLGQTFPQPPDWNETKYEGFRDRLVEAQGLPSWAWGIYSQAAENPIDPATAKAIFLRSRKGTSQPPDVSGSTPFETPLEKERAWAAWYERTMYRNRFGTGDVMAIRELDWMIPPAQDLITMAVREVFSPEQAKALSLFEELPEDFVKWGEKQGLSAFWSKNYWGAHWQLPSPQMGFEMFHRNIITEEELAALLKALDFAPTWREKLTAISYRVITRVDARRMHKLGVLDEVALKEVYGKQGYGPDDAQNMVDFTIKFNADEERDLTKGELIRIYKDGLITQNDVQQGLEDLDYSEHAITMLIAKANFDLEEKEKDLTKAEVRRLYIFEIISANDARARLGEMGILDKAVSLLMRQWDEEKNSGTEEDEGTPKNLSRSEITKLLTLGIVDPQTWHDEMVKIGYTPTQIDWFNIQWIMSQEETPDAE